MAELSGYSGKMHFNTNMISDATNNIHSWSLDINADALDTTSFADSGNRTFIRGLKGWTATCEGFLDSVQAADPADVGTSAALRLYVDATHYYSGTALLTGSNPATPVDGAETVSFSFQGSGALSFT